LQIVDHEGNISHSCEKSIHIDAASNFFSLDNPTPNPVENDINVSFSLSAETIIRLSIYDISGREVAVLIPDKSFAATSHQMSFSTKEIPNGSYTLILHANGNIVTQPFTIAR
jgi:hypothetical protein